MEDSSTINSMLGVLALGSLFVWWQVLLRIRSGREPVPYEPRDEVPWSGWDVAVVIAGVLAVLLVELAIAAHFELQVQGKPDSPTELATVLLATTIAEVIGMGLGIVFLRARGATWSDLGLGFVTLGRDVRLGAATFLAACLPVYGLMFVLTKLAPYQHPLVQLLEKQPDTATLLLATWSAVVVAPIVEEFFLRVLVQGGLEAYERRWQEPAGVDPDRPHSALPLLASSFLFALMHNGNGPDQVPLFVFALFLGYLYRQTHRLAPSVVAHLCLNAVSIVQLWIATAGHAA